MEFLQPETWEEALAAKAERPEALPLWGGTDVMVEMNFARARPAAILDLTRIQELTDWDRENGSLRVGAGRDVHARDRRARRRAAGAGDRVADGRVAADPQPRHGRRQPRRPPRPPATRCRRCLPRARAVEVASSCAARREIPIEDFITGPKRNVLEPDELIAAFHMPAANGGQQFAKIGTRNAMVIAVCSFAIALDADARTVGTASARRRPRRAGRTRPRSSPPQSSTGTAARADPTTPCSTRFGELVAERRLPDRRRARHRRLPPPRPGGHGAAHADLGLGRVPQ